MHSIRYLLYMFVSMGVIALSGYNATAHDPTARATYLANEAIMVTNGDTKIMFDPLFAEGFEVYPVVPAATVSKIMNGEAPFDDIDAIFVSHAHGDHFDARSMITYMMNFTDVYLFASQQAIDMMRNLRPSDMSIFERCVSFDLKNGDAPIYKSIDDISVDVVRIPHAGNWSNVQNMVFRVTLKDSVTVMHMGDAAVNDRNFAPYEDFWLKRQTDHAFPPYWFFGNSEGRKILRERINAKSATGIHVPIKSPRQLHQGKDDYFSKLGESRIIKTPKKEHSHE